MKSVTNRFGITIRAVLAVAFVCSFAARCVASESEMYVARTTIMESAYLACGPIQQTLEMQERRLSELGTLLTSQRVLSNAANTMADLGLKQPAQVLSAVTITPVRDTNILAIEVTLPDPREAKVAADVVAAEFKKVYSDMHTAPLSNRREFCQAWSKKAASALTASINAVKAHKRKHGVRKDDAELAVLEADVVVAKDTYVSVKKKLAEATMQESLARSSVAIVTIDPAYVRRAKQVPEE